MGKKILVTKEWHGRAMQAMQKLHELESLCRALEAFPYLHIDADKQRDFELLLNDYMDKAIENGKV